jgi:hypothetical protein
MALMMEAASTSEMSVNFYHTTWCNIPEDSRLQNYPKSYEHDSAHARQPMIAKHEARR